jgi:AcrR family transcriptional regulator
MAEPARATKDRLLAAATELFAERGFHGTTIRDIAERAAVNVAAGNYHYGSKKALYLEVLRGQFAEIRARLARGGAVRSPEQLRRLPRAAVRQLLQRRLKVMLDLLIGPPPGAHAMLVMREMCDPSEALSVIVREFIEPMVAEMAAIVSHLEPALGAKALERTVFSVMGQAIFYRFNMPAVLRLLGLPAYPRGFAAELAEHITEYSLGGMARVAATRPRGRRAR